MAENSAKAGKKVGDGEGPSSPKRQRKNNGHDEEEDGSCKNGSGALTITDQDVFDCPICFEPLTVPVFQCINGHLACSDCCAKIKRKCPTCSSPPVTVRNRAIEKLIELVQVNCKNAEYGCQQKMSFSKKRDHEKTCQHSPLPCPLSDCSFLGCSSQFVRHFMAKHYISAVPFKYNSLLNVNLNVSDSVLLFQEEKNGHLFVLRNRITGKLGNIISIRPVCASHDKQFQYQIGVRSQKTSLTYKYTRSFQNGLQDYEDFMEGYFFMLSELFGSSNGQCNLEIYIFE